MTRGTVKIFNAPGKPDCWRFAFGLALVASIPQLGGTASPVHADSFVRSTLVVSRILYVGDSNPARSGEGFPLIFNDPNVTGIQGEIFLDTFKPDPGSFRLGSFALTDLTKGAVTTSFSSKSEGSLRLSADGHSLTYMGYIGPADGFHARALRFMAPLERRMVRPRGA
jgi:hypothetical protein